mgnify:CR=1 FL=1
MQTEALEELNRLLDEFRHIQLSSADNAQGIHYEQKGDRDELIALVTRLTEAQEGPTKALREAVKAYENAILDILNKSWSDASGGETFIPAIVHARLSDVYDKHGNALNPAQEPDAEEGYVTQWVKTNKELDALKPSQEPDDTQPVAVPYEQRPAEDAMISDSPLSPMINAGAPRKADRLIKGGNSNE